uniref:Uncharacterized protein n=1 Tax=Gasterosteus aculeatus TaxID=69293 RepID=G3NVR7_GASAC
HRPSICYRSVFLLDCVTCHSGLGGCLGLFLGQPGSRLEHVCSAGGVFADLLLAKAGGGRVALRHSLRGTRHQTFLVLLSLQGQIFLIHFPGPQFDVLPVQLVLQQLLLKTHRRTYLLYTRIQGSCSSNQIKFNTS